MPTGSEARAGNCRQRLRQRSAAEAVVAARNRTDLPAQEESRSSGGTGRPRTAAIPTALDRGAHHRLAGKPPAFGGALRQFVYQKPLAGFGGRYRYLQKRVLAICLVVWRRNPFGFVSEPHPFACSSLVRGGVRSAASAGQVAQRPDQAPYRERRKFNKSCCCCRLRLLKFWMTAFASEPSL
jgi:hypothetical protein